jgi:signal transduction histidine kinase
LLTRGRLQAKMARYIAFAVVVSLVASTAGIVLYRYYSTRQALEVSARHFAALVSGPLAQVADMYGEPGLKEPLMARVAPLLQLNQDIERLEVFRKGGSLALSATREEIMLWPRNMTEPSSDDIWFLGRLQTRVGDAERVRIDGRSVYRVVIPGDEEGQSYTLSLVAIFSYDRINDQLRRGLLLMLLALGLGLIVTERVSLSLSRGITKNLADLQTGVRRIRAGRLDERVDIQSGDEIQELADAFNDMTEDLQQSIGRLRQANVELQALDQLKVDLVANVSHELRTPLTALKGFLELLDAGELGELADEAHRAVGVCRRNVDRLALRVEDLVQLSQMEKAWPENLETQSVDLIPLISMVTEIYEARIRSKGLVYTFEAPDELPRVSGNPEQLERAILNLMDNAVKFTSLGGTVHIAVEECDHEGRAGVLIRVADSGIGIPQRELVRVFDRFHQVDQSIRRRFGGMGLGLSLVHHIVESHRGVVWVESEVGAGSSFFIWLPCRLDSENEHASIPPS